MTENNNNEVLQELIDNVAMNLETNGLQITGDNFMDNRLEYTTELASIIQAEMDNTFGIEDHQDIFSLVLILDRPDNNYKYWKCVSDTNRILSDSVNFRDALDIIKARVTSQTPSNIIEELNNQVDIIESQFESDDSDYSDSSDDEDLEQGSIQLSNNQFRGLLRKVMGKKFLKEEGLIESPTCVVCMETITSKQHISIPCTRRHYFHLECSRKWLTKKCEKPTCPHCREDVRENLKPETEKTAPSIQIVLETEPVLVFI